MRWKDEDGCNVIRQWLIWHHILHVNVYWGVRLFGRYLFWDSRGINFTKTYPHTER